VPYFLKSHLGKFFCGGLKTELPDQQHHLEEISLVLEAGLAKLKLLA